MARIRILKIKGKKSNKPKVVYFHNNNLKNYSSRKRGKYNIYVFNREQKDIVLNRQMRAYSAKIRFHS